MIRSDVGTTGNQESSELDVSVFNVPLYQGMQETCVSFNTDIIDGIRARVVEPRFYYREVASLRGEGDAPWYEHREGGNAIAIRAVACVSPSGQARWVLLREAGKLETKSET